MSMGSDFKDFAMKGNLIDMAVGVVMGAAFGAVSKTFIDGMFMPLVGYIFNVGDLSKYDIPLSPAVIGADGKETTAAVMFQLGGFVSATINFLIVAFVMFMIVRIINNMKKAEPAPAPAPPPGPTADQVLLAEIRDALKK